MKTFKKISIYLIILLAIFAGVDKACLSSFDHSHKQTDYVADEARSENTLISHVDLSEEVVTVTPDVFTFNLSFILSERVLRSESVFPQNMISRIWQPPKVS